MGGYGLYVWGSYLLTLATTLAGFLTSLDGSGRIVGYPLVGYVAVGANLLAIWFAGRIVMHGQAARPGNENRS